MSTLLLLYQWTIAGGALLAVVLAILGCHLAARDKAMQTLCVGQGATLGVLFGIGFIHTFTDIEAAIHWSPLISAFVFSTFTYYLSEKLVAKQSASKNSYYTAIFVALLASSYLVSAVFPALETHMAQVFFGDLATLTNQDAVITLIVAAVSLILFLKYGKVIANQSFDLAIFGNNFGSSKRFELSFNLLTILLLSFSVQFVGFLFTTACLFLPTVLLKRAGNPGLRSHLIKVATLAFCAELIGFLTSLGFPKAPTVPMIALALCLLGGLFKFTTSFPKGS